MPTLQIIDRLTETLHAYNLSWLLPNLRQDFVIWNSLNNEAYFEQFLLSQPQEHAYLPADFSPARLALVALGMSSTARIDPRNLFEAVDAQVLQTAIRNYPGQLFQQADSQDLVQAGMIALALAYKYHITCSWADLVCYLPEQPARDWMAPLSCLYGMVDAPEELLHALLQPGASAERVLLAIHCLLTNPLSIDEQLCQLSSVCLGQYGDQLPASDRIQLVRELQEQHLELAVRFCSEWLSAHPNFEQDLITSQSDPAMNLKSLAEVSFQVKIRQVAGRLDEVTRLLPLETSLLHIAYAGIASQLLAIPTPGEAASRVLSMAVQAVNFPQAYTNAPASGVQLALTLISRGLYEQAANLLPHAEDPLPDDLPTLFAIMKLDHQSGEGQRCSAALARVLELLGQEGALDSLPTRGEFFSLTSLGKLLSENRKPVEASRVFNHALRNCPNDTDLLSQLAKCYQAAHNDQAAAETLRVLICLHPDNLDYRRDFASSLELTGEFQSSLEQHSLILASNPGADIERPIDDYYGYARCALKAHHPELAQETCEELLSNNPNDSQALIFLGEADLLQGQAEQGLICLKRATEVSPENAETWLALAKAQKQTQPVGVVIDTLRAATQAVPDSAQVHHTLGSLYLEDNSPSQALPELRFAADLAPEEPPILMAFAQALQLLGHLEDARAVLARAYVLDPNLPRLAHTYAAILLELGRHEEALSPLELLIDTKAVQDPATYLDYARCVLALHKSGVKSQTPMKALIALNEALQLDPQLSEARALTAEVLAACGENELAFQAYREALDTPLTDDRGWFERLSYGFGCVASAIGKHDIAIAALQEANQTNPNNAATCMALSDVYLLANLPEDAVRSAHNVLAIDGENPDYLSWFAGQMSKILWGKAGEPVTASSSLYKEIPSDVMLALHKAIELAPTRTDLLIQLGNFQSKLGDKEQACTTFASVAGLDFATIGDLQSAAAFLSAIGEHNLAITCLERGIAIDQAVTNQHVPALYSCLAQEFLQNKEHSSALQALDLALVVLPGESSVIEKKIEILLGLNQVQEALDCIETALPEVSDLEFASNLLSTAIRINQALGDISGAVRYARKSVAQSGAGSINSMPLKLRIQLAELYRSLLQPQQAYLILTQDNPSDTILTNDNQDYLDYLCLHTELALELGEPLKHEIQDAQIAADSPKLSRLMAVQARLVNKAGSAKQATRLLQLAINKAKATSEQVNCQEWEIPYFKNMDLVALSVAAAEIGLWEASIELSQQAAQEISDPLPLLNLAKAIILRAEYDELCDAFEVTSHKPSEYARTTENFSLARQYLDQAMKLLERYRDEPIAFDHALTGDQIYRWQARAAIIFNHDIDPDTEQAEVLAQQGSADDTAALINHLHTREPAHADSEVLTRIIKLARAYPRQPVVILQVALALEHSNPADAIKSLQAVLVQNPFMKTHITAFCSFLLARIAHFQADYATAESAIQSAIDFWDNEPCWQALAARVYMARSDVACAAAHWQAAAKLSPRNSTYPMELGKLYMANAAEDMHLIRQACQCFETTLNLQPDEVEALLGLANGQYLLNDLENADRNARKALTQSPDFGRTYQLLGEIAIRRDDFQGAYEYANKAIAASPRDLRSTIVLARSLSALGRHTEALSRLNAAIQTTEQPELLELERVTIISRMDGARAALNELQRLADSHPGNFNILSAMARMYLDVGESGNAVTSAQNALNTGTEQTSRNEQANLHLLIGQILRKAGQLDPSIQHLSLAIQLAPDRLEPYLELGQARKERREYQQALQIFEQATQIAPEDPRALFQAGLALKESKDYKSSESMLRRAVSLAPNDLNIRRQLAAVVALNLVHNPRLGRN